MGPSSTEGSGDAGRKKPRIVSSTPGPAPSDTGGSAGAGKKKPTIVASYPGVLSADRKGAGAAGKKKPKIVVASAVAECPLAAKTYGEAIKIEGDEEFRKKTIQALDDLKKTPTGKAMLESIEKSGKTVTIKPATGGPCCGYDNPDERFKRPDGTPGQGTNATVSFDPDTTNFGSEPCMKDVPPGIQLGHELSHAEQAAYGKTTPGESDNDDIKDPADPTKKQQANTRELETVGVPPHDEGAYTENKLRSEWDPKQPEREYY